MVNAALKRRPRQPVPGRGATFVALLALLLALGSAFVALYSLNVARQAKSSAASAASDAQRLANQSPRTQAPPAPAPSAVASATPTPTPTPTFQHELRAVDLTIPPTVGCQSLFVDADTGQVGDYSGHELYFSSCVGPLSVHLDNIDGAVATGGNTTPEACMALLVGTTPNGEIQFPVSPGMTYCLLTQKTAANRAGIAQHLAVLQIRQVAADRTVTATLDTYRLPG